MNLRSNWCLFGFLTWMVMAGLASAQQEGSVRLGGPANGELPPPLTTFDGNVGQVNLGGGGPGNYTNYDRTFRPRFNVDTRGGGLYGYEPGYTNIGMFLPYTIEDDTAILFGDLRGLVTHDGKGGANVGAGWRWWMEDLDRIIGVSGWYDFDAGHTRSYDQIGLSLESLGRFVDFRMNGYMPIGKRDHVLGTTLDSSNTQFLGNGLFFNRTTVAEQTFTGFDTEVGGPVPLLGRYGVNGYLGGYHFIGNGQRGGSVTGLSTRLMAQVNEDVSVGVQLTDDNVFGTNVQAQVFVTLPEGAPSRWLRNPRVRDRLTASVFRQYRVMAHTDTFDVPVAAINPKDGLPYFVTHIDPNGTAAGTGTIANPFNSIANYNAQSLAQRQQSDILYVRPRIDNTNTNLDTAGTLTLFNGQRLLSTSVQHQFAFNLNGNSVSGNLPGFVTGADLPLLFNSAGGDVVTLAANASQCIEVSGFDITGSATGNGIRGTDNTFVLINNNIIHGALNGVLLTNLTGTVANGTAAVFENNIIGDRILTDANNTRTFANIEDGIRVTNTNAAPLDVTVIGNDFTNNGDDGLQLDANGTSVIGGIIGGVTITQADPGPPAVAAVTLGNNFRDNGAHGLHLTANGTGALNFLSPPGPTGSGIINNDFTANGLDGLRIETTGGANGNYDIISNRFGAATDALTGNQRYGLSLTADSGTTNINIGGANTPADPGPPPVAAVTRGNVFDFNAVSAIDIAVTGTAILNYNIENNTVRNASSATTPAPRDAVAFSFNGISGTDSFTITNNSDAGIDITQVTWNLSGTPALFDSNNVGIGAGNSALEPQNASDLLTGLTTVNNFLVIPGGVPPLTAAATGNPVGTVEIPDGSQNLALGYNNFNTGETFEATTILSNNIDPGVRNATPLSSLATAGSTVTVQFSNALSTTFALSQVNLGGIAVAGSGQVFGQASPGFGAGGDGIHVSASGNSSLNQSVIRTNTVTGYGGFGIHVETSGNAQAPNIVIDNNITSFNGTGVNGAGASIFTGGGLSIDRYDSSLNHSLIHDNQITSNFNDGFTIVGAGTVVGDMIVNSHDNQVLNNAGDGAELLASEQVVLTFNSTRDQFIGNNFNGFRARTDGTSTVQLDFQNVLATGNVGSGFDALAQGNSSLQVFVTSPVDPLFTGVGSAFSNNGQHGFAFGSVESGLASVNLTNTLFNDNSRDGLNFNREGASLTLVDLADSQVTRNADDGIQFYTTGASPFDPNQPLTPQPNQLSLNNVTVNANGATGAPNGGNGLEVATFATSVLVLNAELTTFNNNATDGVRIFSGNGSSFGQATNRSTFNGVTITGNVRDGIKLFAQGLSDTLPSSFIEVNSNSGNTMISNNGDDGIQGTVTFGAIDILVQGDTVGVVNFDTRIQHNGFLNGVVNRGGNGIELNVGDAAVDGDDIADNGGLPAAQRDGDRDGGANEVANFFTPNPFQLVPPVGTQFGSTATLDVRDILVGDENVNDNVNTGNAGDGIEVWASNNFNYLARYAAANGQSFNNTVFSVGSLVNLNVERTDISGNGQHGLNITGDGYNREVDGFNLINAVVDSSRIAANAQNGVNIDLEGRFGFTQGFPGGPPSPGLLRTDTNSFVFTNNLIERNGNNGLFYQSNAADQQRFGSNSGLASHIRIDFFDPQPTNPPFPYDPDNVAFNGGDVFNTGYNTTDAFIDLYLNLRTDLNSALVFHNNRVQFNGSQNVGLGDGMFIRVGTDTYLSADLGGTAGDTTGNVFSGNVLTDVHFESFIAFDPATGNVINPGTSVPANPGPDIIFLDDTAQLDLRFNNNTAAQVSAPFALFPTQAAIYALSDIGGGKGVGPRAVQLFQVDDGINLNANNTIPQDLNAVFQGGNFHQRTAVADPFFPNPAFPENYFFDPGDPFLP